MNIILIDGQLGSGKTTLMSWLANHYALRCGCSLFSNFEMKTARDFTSHRSFLDVTDEPSSFVSLDEAHTLADSRDSNSNRVKFFTQLCYYLRKMRCTIALTSPDMSAVDVRVREIANLYVRAQRRGDRFVYDLYDNQSASHIRRIVLPTEKAFGVAGHLFDTNAMVTPIYMPEKRPEFEEFMIELKERTEVYYKKREQSQAVTTGAALA